MSNFLKKIIPTGEPEKEKRRMVLDIVPKRAKQREEKERGIPKPPKEPAGVAPKKEPDILSEEKERPERKPPPLPEIPVKRWEPERHGIASFRASLARLFRQKRLMIFGAGVLLVAVLFIFTAVFARLTIIIRPVTARVPVSPLDISADTKIASIEAEAQKIPGLKIGVEKTYHETFLSTGKKYIEDHARGRIKVFNAFSSAPQVLVQNTRFVDPEGKVYKLAKTTTIPGAKIEEGKIIPSSIEAEVVAEKAGEEYNIAPTHFTIPGFKGTPKYDTFSGKSEEGFMSGFRGEADIVTAGDIKHAQEKVSQEVFNQLRQTLEEKTPKEDDFIALEGSRRIEITELVGPKLNERINKFTVEAKGKAEVIIFKKSNLLTLLGVLLLAPERPAVLTEIPGKLRYTKVRLDAQTGKLFFSVEGEALGVRILPVEEIRSQARSKGISALEAYLRGRQEIAGFSIKNSPPWRWWTPSQEGAIKIKIEIPER